MQTHEIEKVFDQHWNRGWGSVSCDETEYIQTLIATNKPKRFLEIGMASGLSGGLIATILEENGGDYLCTIDHDNTFFGDPSKENGFLIEEIYQGKAVTVEKLPFTTALDLPDLGKRFDMAFIDANHQHPWPLIDTLCLYPFMDGNKLIVHHDLNLYKNQKVPYGIGPKYLYDQIPESKRDRSTANSGNIFSVELTLPGEAFESLAADLLQMPWSLRTAFSAKQISAVTSVLETYYSESLVACFHRAVARFNHPLSPPLAREVS